MDKTEKFLLNLVKNRNNIGNLDEKEIMTMDYLSNGLVDSLQFMEMVGEIEDKYSIVFSSDDLESRDFRSLAGLSNIIKKYKTNGKTRI